MRIRIDIFEQLYKHSILTHTTYTHTHCNSPSEKLTVGRCVVDVRVCASPGRDKSMEENKMANGSSSSSLEPSRKRSKKQKRAEGVVVFFHMLCDVLFVTLFPFLPYPSILASLKTCFPVQCVLHLTHLLG